MSELKSFNSERIYWAVEQVERVAGDIDTLHLDDSQYYLKSEADKVIAEKDKEIAELKEERRWRKFPDEKPKLEEDVSEIFLVVVENESNTSPKGSYVTIAELCDGEWYNDVTGNEIEENIEGSDYFYRSKVTHWRPMPSAPKEQA